VSSWVYSLPGLGGSRPWARTLGGGWQISGLLSWQSGFPFSVVSGQDNSRSGVGQDRADYTGAASRLGGSRPKGELLARYFNTAAFVPNALGTFGNSGRNILRGLRQFNMDLAAAKDFRLAESVRLHLRGEVFNAANTPAFNNPNATVGVPAYGQILSAADPRILQFALKVVF
jgi:hypothetical protein